MTDNQLGSLETAVFSPIGVQLIDTQPADIILIKDRSFHSKMRSIGNFLTHYKDSECRHWNRAGVLINTYGDFIEATPSGIKQNNLNAFDANEYFLLKLNISDDSRKKTVQYVQSISNTTYSMCSTLSVLFSSLTGHRISFGFQAQQSNSGLVVKALDKTEVVFNREAHISSTADLSHFFDIQKPL